MHALILLLFPCSVRSSIVKKTSASLTVRGGNSRSDQVFFWSHTAFWKSCTSIALTREAPHHSKLSARVSFNWTASISLRSVVYVNSSVWLYQETNNEAIDASGRHWNICGPLHIYLVRTSCMLLQWVSHLVPARTRTPCQGLYRNCSGLPDILACQFNTAHPRDIFDSLLKTCPRFFDPGWTYPAHRIMCYAWSSLTRKGSPTWSAFM